MRDKQLLKRYSPNYLVSTTGKNTINILLWILLNGSLNTSQVLQRKLPFFTLMPSVSSFLRDNGNYLNHLFFILQMIIFAELRA